MKDATLNIRIDGKTKIKAQKALQNIGISLSDAVNIFLVHVIEHGNIGFIPGKKMV